jgi:hypothetical protein
MEKTHPLPNLRSLPMIAVNPYSRNRATVAGLIGMVLLTAGCSVFSKPEERATRLNAANAPMSCAVPRNRTATPPSKVSKEEAESRPKSVSEWMARTKQVTPSQECSQ